MLPNPGIRKVGNVHVPWGMGRNEASHMQIRRDTSAYDMLGTGVELNAMARQN